jgi:uncharacterized protein (TIGR02996 family)
MSQDDALLQAILDAPDDAARLVSADWLDQHGQLDRASMDRRRG